MISILYRKWVGVDLRNFIKPLILVAVLVISGLLGGRATPRTLQLVGAIAGGIFSLIILTRWPEWGLLALIAVSYFGRWQIGTGTNVSLNLTYILSALLLGVWIMRMIMIERNVKLFPSQINIPILAFILTSTISLLAGNYHWVLSAPSGASLTAQIGGWGLYVFSLGIFLLVANQVRDQIWLRRMTWLFLGFGGLYILARCLSWYGNDSIDLFVTPNSGTNPFGGVFWTWFAAIAFGQSLVNTELRLRWRLLLGLLLGVSLFSGWFLFREWVSGWLPPLVAMAAILWLRSWRWGFLLALISIVVVFFSFTQLSSQIMTPTQEYSTLSRVATWPILFELIKANPILGLGFANYSHYTSLFPILGWYVNFNSHNNYLDIILQTGLIGFCVFAWFIYEIAHLGWRLRARVQDGFSRGYIYAAMGGLVGMLVSGGLGDWFLPYLYNIGIPGFRSSIFAWLFLGGLIALDRITKDKESSIVEV